MDARLPRIVPDPAALVSEANHRIANQLSLVVGMVQLQASALAGGPETLTRATVYRMLQETAGKIINISHLHRRLSRAPGERDVDCAAYLVESIDALIESLTLGGQACVVYELGKRWFVPAEKAQALSLIAGEIVINAVKYAHSSALPVLIRIVCKRDSKGRPFIEIYDDGAGLPENFDETKNGGLGFRLIRSLTNQIGASLKIDSSTLGLCFRLTLPL